jgi:predicted DNA binding CopG/RHH family protein
MKKKIPVFSSDEEAERFVDTADLSEYDVSDFRPVDFKFAGETAHIELELPQSLLDALKHRAKTRGIPFVRYIRELMERDISQR